MRGVLRDVDRRTRVWLLAIWVALIAAGFLFDHTGAVAGGVTGAGLAQLLVVPSITRARGRRYARRGRVQCALRLLEGSQPGLGRRWRHGIGTPTPGLLTFRATIGGSLFLQRPPQMVEIVRVDGAHPRATGLGEALTVRPGTQVIQVRTHSAELELGVGSDHLKWLLQRLQPPPPGIAPVGDT